VSAARVLKKIPAVQVVTFTPGPDCDPSKTGHSSIVVVWRRSISHSRATVEGVSLCWPKYKTRAGRRIIAFGDPADCLLRWGPPRNLRDERLLSPFMERRSEWKRSPPDTAEGAAQCGTRCAAIASGEHLNFRGSPPRGWSSDDIKVKHIAV
jgi:hypothetical protein